MDRDTAYRISVAAAQDQQSPTAVSGFDERADAAAGRNDPDRNGAQDVDLDEDDDRSRCPRHGPSRPDARGLGGRSGTALAAVLVLADTAPTPVLVWDERHGWRTAISRRHPIPNGGGWPGEDDAVRCLYPGHTEPDLQYLLAEITTHGDL
ncbi:hypothetical protein GPA10_09400 [Streptomyces sp. p1417]|uniref:Uncharacterized protein n=1 Tax=Streptomyces typhae TaxID=2681492 RepID=A0A6L6WRQ8_9ACTN|nr:hypothetical protein [Streptomyces typhae]MVO84972.1 hypothetical protein [Streptomyces typhae]